MRLEVEASGGQLMSVMGDGTLSVFDSPTKAVRCAESICGAAAADGVSVRAGVHTGELQRDGMNVTGMSVHIGARVSAAAGPGEVMVSRTVHDLVVGSGLTFASRGEHDLKGVPGEWELFAVTHAGEQADTVPIEKSMQTSTDKMALQAARRVPALSRAAMRMGQRRRTPSRPYWISRQEVGDEEPEGRGEADPPTALLVGLGMRVSARTATVARRRTPGSLRSTPVRSSPPPRPHRRSRAPAARQWPPRGASPVVAPCPSRCGGKRRC